MSKSKYRDAFIAFCRSSDIILIHLLNSDSSVKLMLMRIEYEGASDQGKIRPNNEDAWIVDASSGIYVVSDGMGGLPAGEVASNLVCELLPRILKGLLHEGDPDQDIEQAMKTALIRTSHKIYQAGLQSAKQKGMGATAVLSLIKEQTLFISHVGDSRIYLLRMGELFRLTTDHSHAQELIDQGALDPNLTRGHPGRFQLTQCMGMNEDPGPGFYFMNLENKDRILMATDGLSDMLDDERIKEILLQNSNLAQACQSLIDAANEAGGLDNITTLVLEANDTHV